MAMLPPLLRQMAKEAPRCDLDVRTIGADLEEALEDGRIDLALGVFPRLSGRIMKQRLFSDRLTSLVRRGHPAARGRLTRERFAALAHIQIAPRGTPGGPVDDALSGHGLQRRVAVRIGSFLSATQLVADSDLVLTAPERLARVLVGALPLQMIKPPLELPEFHIYQVWHERRQQDPAHAWLRGSLAAIAQVI
jgi:DNA-binding transcriptional LysR family regulator